MRILVISDGLDVVMQHTFNNLATHKNHEIYIIGPASAHLCVESSGGVKSIDSQQIKSKFSLRVIPGISRAIREKNIDIVFAPSTSGLSNALIASIGTKARIVGYRGTQHRIHRSDPTNYLALLNPRVSHVVCETSDIESYLAKFIPARKLSWHPKPYSTDWVADAISNPIESPFKESSIKCIFIGSTKGRPFKGLAYALEAMRILEHEGVTLTVIGSVSDEDRQSAPANVAFTGSRHDAIHFLPSHDILVLPSTRDASPRVVREAQACSVPCVVTDIPGARDLIIPNKTGLLVPPANAKALAEAIMEIGKDPEKKRQMGEAGRRNIENNYRLESYADYFHNLFLKLT